MMDRREERSVAPVPAAFPPLVGKAVAGWVRICPGQTKALAQRSLVSPGSVAFPFEGAYSVRLFSLRAPVGLCALILKGNHSSIGRNVDLVHVRVRINTALGHDLARTSCGHNHFFGGFGHVGGTFIQSNDAASPLAVFWGPLMTVWGVQGRHVFVAAVAASGSNVAIACQAVTSVNSWVEVAVRLNSLAITRRLYPPEPTFWTLV